MACRRCGGPTRVTWSIGRQKGRADGDLLEVLPGLLGVRRHRRCLECNASATEVAAWEDDARRWAKKCGQA